MSTVYAYEGEGILKKRVAVIIDDVAAMTAFFNDFSAKVEKHVGLMLDLKANERGYGDIVSACSYAGYTNPFQKESQQYLAWRGALWKALYDYSNEVKTGVRPVPTSVDEVVATLPVFDSFLVN